MPRLGGPNQLSAEKGRGLCSQLRCGRHHPAKPAAPTCQPLSCTALGLLPSSNIYTHRCGVQMSSFSMASLSCWIWFFSWLPSLVVTLHAITGRDTPQPRPSAALEGTKT